MMILSRGVIVIWKDSSFPKLYKTWKLRIDTEGFLRANTQRAKNLQSKIQRIL